MNKKTQNQGTLLLQESLQDVLGISAISANNRLSQKFAGWRPHVIACREITKQKVLLEATLERCESMDAKTPKQRPVQLCLIIISRSSHVLAQKSAKKDLQFPTCETPSKSWQQAAVRHTFITSGTTPSASQIKLLGQNDNTMYITVNTRDSQIPLHMHERRNITSSVWVFIPTCLRQIGTKSPTMCRNTYGSTAQETKNTKYPPSNR